VLYYEPSVFSSKETVLEQLLWIRKYLAENYKQIEDTPIAGNLYTEIVDLNGSEWTTEYIDLPLDKFLKKPSVGDTFDITVINFENLIGVRYHYAYIRYKVYGFGTNLRGEDYVSLTPVQLLTGIRKQPTSVNIFIDMGGSYDWSMISSKTISASAYSGDPYVGELITVPIKNYSNPVFTQTFSFGYVMARITAINSNGSLALDFVSYIGGVA
jgi:hypothetical protein